jgi:tetratricopeptide (TPR) repeat protein
VTVVVIAAVVIVVARPGGTDQSATTQGGGGGGGSAPVADTGGSYNQLVQRANGLYDDGTAKFQAGDAGAAAEYFTAAAEVYAAAWAKQPGDPNVGTDWATSLFYSGDIDGAVARVDKVLTASPDFQPGWYNRGNYLEHRARGLDSEGDTAGAAKARKEAEAAFRKAVSIDATSDVGKAAAERLKSVTSGV